MKHGLTGYLVWFIHMRAVVKMSTQKYSLEVHQDSQVCQGLLAELQRFCCGLPSGSSHLKGSVQKPIDVQFDQEAAQ